MEKRRNTLDRFQRLGFGRKPTLTGSSSKASDEEKQRKSNLEKSERLKELTELLRGGSRSSPTASPPPQPPIPPPRKPRLANLSAGNSPVNSFERQDTNASQTLTENDQLSSVAVGGNVQNKYNTTSKSKIKNNSGNNENDKGSTGHSIRSDTISTPSATARILASLKPNTSLSNLESLMLANREMSKSPPPLARCNETTTSSEWASQVSRPNINSATRSSTHTQKSIPFRSVSFSQIDCKSTLGALRDRLRREKIVIDAEASTPRLPLHIAKNTEDRLLVEKNERERSPDPGWIHIPLKKTQLTINLNYGEEISFDQTLENVSDTTIPEEDIFNTDNSSASEVRLPATESSVLAAHAKMESLSDTIQSDSEFIINIGEEQPLIMQGGALPPSTSNDSIGAIAPNLATLMEEQLPLESPPDNFLQTATTCLIPVPVYECAAQEWLETPAQEWVEVTPEEFGIVPETIQPLLSHAACKVSQTDTLKTMLRSDLVPTISVSRSSEEGDERAQVEELAMPAVQLATVATVTTPDQIGENRIPQSSHLQKLYSHDDLDLTQLELRNSLEAMPRYNTDERLKRNNLDKSTKRKGMYIDNADWRTSATAHRGLSLDISIANLNDVKLDSPEGLQPIDDPRTPSSYSFDLNTPEVDCGISPSWGHMRDREKAQMLSSFSCQSSEEKDDASSSGGNKSVSPSPTPSTDYDYKRYFKRPLRGPYGQMLEAEMKKPNRMHFEELRETDSFPQRRQHGDITNNSNTGRVNLPQYSNSMRMRKSNTYLPVPAHARAASTPSQIEHVSKLLSAASIPTSTSANDINKIPSATSTELLTSTLDNPQHTMKRAASETPTTKTYHTKRSQSMNNEKPNSHQYTHHSHHYHHHHGSHGHHHMTKRNLDTNANKNGSKSKDVTTALNAIDAMPNLKPTPALLAELLKGSSENMLSEQRQKTIADTRTYVVQEIYRNEQSYVEALQTVVFKYLKVLKAPEHAGMIDTRTVDEIFFMVPDILEIHEKFLAELKQRLDDWDTQQKVGDAFMETFSKLEVLEVYTSFVNNCNRAKNAIRSMKHQRPSFAKFLESTAREHKGKLTLDNLLIKPVQKFPNYELLFQRLIKHTEHDHPDQKHIQDVLKLVHDILVHINCKEREIMENGQREATLRELEGVIEGISDLIRPDRQFLLFDLVSMPSGQGARKERGFFLFNDLLVLTSIKKRSGTIRKPNTSVCPGTVATTLDSNKYKFLTKISLDCLDVVKSKDENVKRIMSEIENLSEDCNKLQQMTDIIVSLKYPHQYLEDVIRELHRDVQRQLSERQTNDAQFNILELAVSSPNGSQKLTVVFSKTEKRTQWEEAFNEAKQKLASTLERHPIPEFLTSIPIRKTRAGLQFTCAAATLSDKRDVWVCNSDGYVGQVCIMSLHPEPNVTSCNGVCNARILCVASVPAYNSTNASKHAANSEQTTMQNEQQGMPNASQHSYTQKLRDYRKSISPSYQPAATSIIPSGALTGPSSSATPEKKKMSTINNAAATVGITTGNIDTQLELNLSSSDDETDAVAAASVTSAPAIIGIGSRVDNMNPALMERIPSPAPSSTMTAVCHSHQDSYPEETECNQSTMWIGTEDGCIHVYNSTDNIRIKKNRIKIEHHSAVHFILYLDNRVFVSLANGDICVYLRDGVTSWNTCSSHCLSIGTVTSPVTKLLNVNGKLWCSIQGIIKVVDIETLLVVNQIQISSDSKPITNMTVSNSYVWISIQNSAHIKCFHSNTAQLITEVNLAPAVNKMLSNCDEIIRQHKAACLRVTSLLCCRDLIWIGTSAGVLLTIPAEGYEKGAHNIVPTGIPHGHTGHVRFLTFVETTGLEGSTQATSATGARESGNSDDYTKQGSIKHSKHSKPESNNILIISGGDGYEDFRNSGANSLSEIAGREDSTNHLLIWQI